MLQISFFALSIKKVFFDIFKKNNFFSIYKKWLQYFIKKSKEMLQRKARENHQNLSAEEKTKNTSKAIINTGRLLQEMNLLKKKNQKTSKRKQSI